MRARFLAVLALWLACAERASPPPAESAALPPGTLASVAGEAVARATVERIAVAQGVSPEQARRLAVSDALFAAAARADPSQEARVRVAERAAYGRELLDVLAEEARRQGPPSDAELAELRRERWVELDRPVAVRTTHAVLRAKADGDPALASKKAAELARALDGASEPEEFIRRAKAFPAAPFELRAERLSAVVADGRSFDPDAPPGKNQGPNYDLAYARAAHAIRAAGTQSPVVETPFGLHVILLEERLPERRVPLEELRVTLAPDVEARRARKSLKELLSRLSESSEIEIARAADELTARVAVDP